MRKRLTVEEFITRAKQVHGDKFDYSEVIEYKNNHTKVCIICPKHGKFWQSYQSHVDLRYGCPKCRNEKLADERRKPLNSFIEQAKQQHNGKYDYSQVHYVNNRTKVKIKCPKHGVFEQCPDHHLQGKGCPKCGKEERGNSKRKLVGKFIEQASAKHSIDYDYSQVQYVNNRTPVKIICPYHGSFMQSPYSHLSGRGCPICGKVKQVQKQTLSSKSFVDKANQVHSHKYDYSKVSYVNRKVPVEIECPKHGVFIQSPSKHLNGQGCPKCTLKSQTKIYKILCDAFPNEDILFEVGQQIVKWIENQRLDIYFPKYNIAVEYDGEQHFMPIEHFGGLIRLTQQKQEDILKEYKCAQNNCILYRLKYNYAESDLNALIQSIKINIENYEKEKE